MASKYLPGDRVRATQGGPILLVKQVDQGRVVCAWYETGKGWVEKTFDEWALRRVGRSLAVTR
jgi:uncharacterized protein YodC (DUF2158 family)